MISDQSLWTTQFLTLLAVLEPVGHLSMYLAATSHLSASQKRRAAVIAIGLSYVVILLFGLIGLRLLKAMDVSLLSFQIAGGLIVLAFAGQMVMGAPHKAPGPASADAGDNASALETAIYPLTVPIIAGPGALLSVVVLMDNARHSIANQLQVAGLLAVVLLIMLAAFVAGERILRVIGAGGANLLRRVLGMILAAIAVNLILNAFAAWLHLPPI